MKIVILNFPFPKVLGTLIQVRRNLKRIERSRRHARHDVVSALVRYRYRFIIGNVNFASERESGAHTKLHYSFEIDRYSANKQMMSNWNVYLQPPWSAAPPHPASPTFSPYLPRFSNLSIFCAAAAAAVCDCAPLRNRTEVGEREREIFGMAEEEEGGGELGEGGGGGRKRGICRDYSASAIDHKKRKSPAAQCTPSLSPSFSLSLPRCWRNIQSGRWVSSFISLAPNQLFILHDSLHDIRLVISRNGMKTENIRLS